MKKFLIKVLDCFLGINLWCVTAISFICFFVFLTDSPDTDYIGRTKYDALASSFGLFVFSIFYCLSLAWSRAIFNKDISWKNFKHFYILALVSIALMSSGLLYELYEYELDGYGFFYVHSTAFIMSPFLTIALFLVSVVPSKQSILKRLRRGAHE